MSGDAVVVERHGARGELVINRPEADNWITPAVYDGLEAGLADLVADPSVGAIVLRGAGGSFSGGLDLAALREIGPPEVVSARRIAVHAAIIDSPKPVVAALERHAIAGGAALALSCDLLVAGDDATLWLPEVAIKMVAWLNTALLVRRFGEVRALELTLDARRFTGRELAARGIATVADADPLDTARALADRIAGHDGPSLARTKAYVAALAGGPARAWLEDAIRRFAATRPSP